VGALPGLAVAVLAPAFLALPAAGLTAGERGAEAFGRRAEGFAESGRVAPEPAAAAVAAYEEAVAAAPGDVDLRLALTRALYFQGEYAVADPAARQRIFARQLAVARGTVERVEACCGGSEALSRLAPAERARRLAAVPAARAAHYWAAISWGVWGRSHGNFAAARQGVAAKIRDHAEVVRQLDEGYDDAGALRLLGRLHTVAPRVPFFTGWIDPPLGIRLLRRACELAASEPQNPLFLAEALLDHEPASRAEALALLAGLAGRRPDPDRLVEQTRVLAEARRVLAAAGGAVPPPAADPQPPPTPGPSSP
jgi:hypothetical protein